MSFLLFILLALASYRGTRFVTRDKLPLIDIPRNAFVLRWGAYEDAPRMIENYSLRWWRFFWGSEWQAIDGQHKTNLIMKSLAYLWECDWCTGVWVAGVMVYTTTNFTSVPYPYLQWLAAAALTGILAEREKP